MNILNDYNKADWKQLKQFRPSENEKAEIRERLWKSIQNETYDQTPKRSFQWKVVFTTCLFVLICSGFIYNMIQNEHEAQTDVRQLGEGEEINWEFKNVVTKKISNGWEIYRKNGDLLVGTIALVSEEEKNKLIAELPMFVTTELESFPYKTSMNIEHVKTMDTVQRYHFFITLGEEKIAHITFDYPKLEYAEIFQAMETLKIEGFEAKKEITQPYVNHGYGSLLFPVGLEPISISHEEEIYHWEQANSTKFKAYLEKIAGDPFYRKQESESIGETATFISSNEKEIVKITLEGKRLIYEFTYFYDEE